MTYQRRGTAGLFALGATVLALHPSPARAQPSLSVRQVGVDTSSFTAIAARPGDPDHVFALTRDGRILVVENGTTLLATPLLDFSALVVGGSESGALGMAFDPDYASNGYVYIAHTTQTVVGQPPYVLVRYTVSPPLSLVADGASRTMVMPLTPAGEGLTNHQGGWIGFGPDGYLYITRGENPGGGTNAQDPNTIRGKVLRIDVRSDAFPGDPLRHYAIPPGNPFAGDTPGADEVFAVGLRNPWRASFDRQSGDLWVGDVGALHEEIDIVPLDAAPPMNFGWPCYDGQQRFIATGLCAGPVGLSAARVEFTRSSNTVPAFNSTCLAGGVVYRGCEAPAMYGRYIYGGCTDGSLASFDIADPTGTAVRYTNALPQVYTFGEDAHGEVYIGTARGLFRLAPPDGTFTDCNANGRADACEIADGSATDDNGDGLPDTCTRLCSADLDASGQVNVGDVFFFLNRFFRRLPPADTNGDGAYSVQDVFDYLALYFNGCP